nr:DUF4347 domain-containing protein [Burkholderiales bacterium]
MVSFFARLFESFRTAIVPAEPGRDRMLVEAIEPRILHSADISPIQLADLGADAAAETRYLDAEGEFTDDAQSVSQQQSKEIVFVDAGTPGYQELIDQLVSGLEGSEDPEVVLIDSMDDGIETISKVLSSRNDLSAVHIISHGSEGSIELGTVSLDSDSLAQRASDITLWANAFSDSGDILIYGCNLAANDAGQDLVDDLAILTRADVAASEDLTGHADLGGDWDLEYQVGEIETGIVVSAELQEGWEHTLATSTFQQDVNGYVGTQDTQLMQGDPATAQGSLVEVTVDQSSGGGIVDGLIRFDNLFGSGAGEIPVGAIIDDVTLTFRGTGATADTVSLHRMLVDWDQVSATWNSFGGGLTSGTDYSATVDSSVAGPGTGDISYTGANLVATLQAWSDGASNNYGWAIINSGTDGWDFASSENTTDPHPLLQVNWHIEDVTLYYGDDTAGMPKTQAFNDGTGTWSAENTTSATGDTVKWTVAEASPTSQEELVAVLTQTGAAVDLQVLRWSGGSWTTDWTDGTNTVSFADVDKRSFDLAYEQTSGHALIVYADDDDNPMYRTWDGSSWSSPTAVFSTSPGTGNVLWVELVSNPNNDQIALVYSDSNNDLHSVIWNGSSWDEAGTEITLETALGLTDSGLPGQYRTFDAAYENSGDLMVAWGTNAGPIGYATMAAGTTTWTTGGTVDPITNGVSTFIDLAAEPGGDRIALAAIDENGGVARLGLATWDGVTNTWLNAGQYDNNFNHINALDYGSFFVGVGWVGTSGEAVAVYSDADAGNVNWASWSSASGWTVQTDVNITGSTSLMRSVQIKSFEAQDKLMAVFSDDLGDLYAATYDGTTWTITNAGTALETLLSDAQTVNFDFAIQSVLNNGAPMATDNTVNTPIDTPYVFTAADFNYSDGEGDPFTQIQI